MRWVKPLSMLCQSDAGIIRGTQSMGIIRSLGLLIPINGKSYALVEK